MSVSRERQRNYKGEAFYMSAVDILICNHTVRLPSALKHNVVIKSPRGRCARNY